MPIMKSKIENEVIKKSYTKMILPIYVILSALFIIYAAYSYLGWVVYNQGSIIGKQQWYEAAVIDLMNRVASKCDPVTLTAWETKINVINVACLQQNSVENIIPEEE